jgi:hypothetical protein
MAVGDELSPVKGPQRTCQKRCLSNETRLPDGVILLSTRPGLPERRLGPPMAARYSGGKAIPRISKLWRSRFQSRAPNPLAARPANSSTLSCRPSWAAKAKASR